MNLNVIDDDLGYTSGINQGMPQNLRLALVQLLRLACVHGPPGATDLKEPRKNPFFLNIITYVKRR